MLPRPYHSFQAFLPTSLSLPKSSMSVSLPATTTSCGGGGGGGGGGGSIHNTINRVCIRVSPNHTLTKPLSEINSHCNKLSFVKTKSSFKNSQLKWLTTTTSAISSSSGSETSSATEGIAGMLEGVVVFDLNGNEIPITDLWKERKSVVAFARHFGCVLCRTRADYLANEKDKMDAAGVSLVLIGPGSVNQAKAFYEQTKFKGEVYADPSYSSYKALQFVSGVTTTFTSAAGLKIIEAYLEGYRQDWALSFEKDTRTRGGWQQGGIIVAGPGKQNISYIHKDKEAGDDPDIGEILKACCSQGG